MVASGDFTAADGPGGKASRFLDAVVAFVIGIFQPIFHFLLSAIFTRKPRQHNNQNRDRHNTLGDSPHDNSDNSDNNDNNTGDHNGLHQGGSSPESMQRHAATTRPQHAYGPKAANGSSLPPVKPALPRIGPSVDSPRPANQEGTPTNGVPPKTALQDVTNTANPASKHHVVGEKEAEENLHDQVDLAPAVQPVGGEDEPEDPAKAAERVTHHGFMDQALDMVCPASSFFSLSSSKTFSSKALVLSAWPCTLPLCQSFLDAHHIVTPLSCCTRSCCRVSKLSTSLHAPLPSARWSRFV